MVYLLCNGEMVSSAHSSPPKIYQLSHIIKRDNTHLPKLLSLLKSLLTFLYYPLCSIEISLQILYKYTKTLYESAIDL